jgi:hypothetical protein
LPISCAISLSIFGNRCFEGLVAHELIMESVLGLRSATTPAACSSCHKHRTLTRDVDTFVARIADARLALRAKGLNDDHIPSLSLVLR